MPTKKPAKQEPKPELTYVPEDGLPKLFFIQTASGEWWGPNEAGYTASLLSAGLYPEAKADELAKRRPGDQTISLERAVHEATRAANPVVLAAIAAKVGR